MRVFMTLSIVLSPLLLIGCEQKMDVKAEDLAIGDIGPEVVGVKYLQGPAVSWDSDHSAYLIEFWATWCAPCKDSAPVLSAYQEQYADRGLLVAGLSDEEESMVKPYLGEYGHDMSYTIGLDPDGVIQKKFIEGYGEMGIPWAFLLGKDGTLLWVGHPMAPELGEELEKLLPAV